MHARSGSWAVAALRRPGIADTDSKLLVQLRVWSRVRESFSAVFEFATASIEEGGLGAKLENVVVVGASLGTGLEKDS